MDAAGPDDPTNPGGVPDGTPEGPPDVEQLMAERDGSPNRSIKQYVRNQAD